VGVTTDNRVQYRALIDRLVHSCLEGQGRIGADRVRRGVWNQEATARSGLRDQQKANDLLSRMYAADRDVFADMLFDAFVSGVHEALVVLHEHAVAPFEDGYEGTPFHDFVGRLQGWSWPVNSVTAET
jgi:hypothetical protein